MTAKTPRKRPGQAGSAAFDDDTQSQILEAAIEEFSRYGLSGARVDQIAAESGANKSMIYYYFVDKKGLYIAALAESYRRFRRIEHAARLDHLEPREALSTLVGLTFDFHAKHPEFIRIVMNENINFGEYIRSIPELRAINRPAIALLESVCLRGMREGAFRPGLDPRDLHLTISALCFHNVSNQYTLGFIFERDAAAPEVHAQRRATVIDVILRYVSASSSLAHR